jgi:Flp pilus assembly protein TadG
MPQPARRSFPRRPNRDREHGQIIVLFTLVLLVMVAVAGMLLDGGMASQTRRQAQAAADTAALAAAQQIAIGVSGATAAQTLAAANGFPNATTDCSGQSINGVTVNNPPTSGSYSGQSGYVEVTVQRPMKTGFSGLVGQSCWMVSARAVAAINSSAVAACSFCSLNDSDKNHTLVLKNSSTLRVDGEIYVNSTNGYDSKNGIATCTLKSWNVCGDGFDVFGDGGSISAKAIAVAGGWETHDLNIATADGLDKDADGTDCDYHPNPPAQAQSANVCIHMPQIPDPLNDSTKPGNVVIPPTPGARPIAGTNGCPSYATSSTGTTTKAAQLVLSSGSPTICPGTYYGGIKISSSASVTMVPGVYNIVGGGFQVLNSASLDGSAGVMIYNSSGSGEAASTTPGTDRVPAAIVGHTNPKISKHITSSNPNSAPGETTTYTIEYDKAGAVTLPPSGTVDFYDGNVIVCAAVPVVSIGGTKVRATCTQSYDTWGTRAISAVYSGDINYNAIGDTYTQTIVTPAGTNIAAFTINTTGTVKLYGPKSGAYSGLTIFQDRTSNLVITLSPGSSGVACPGGFMTANLVGAAAWKDGCGPIGGLQGTVYAAHDDALVLITASGLAPLQVMAGMIEIDSGASARFAYNASVFANGHVHLVE